MGSPQRPPRPFTAPPRERAEAQGGGALAVVDVGETTLVSVAMVGERLLVFAEGGEETGVDLGAGLAERRGSCGC